MTENAKLSAHATSMRPGMSKRELIATHLAAGLMANSNIVAGMATERDAEVERTRQQLLAAQAVSQADALLAALEPDEVLDLDLDGGQEGSQE